LTARLSQENALTIDIITRFLPRKLRHLGVGFIIGVVVTWGYYSQFVAPSQREIYGKDASRLEARVDALTSENQRLRNSLTEATAYGQLVCRTKVSTSSVPLIGNEVRVFFRMRKRANESGELTVVHEDPRSRQYWQHKFDLVRLTFPTEAGAVHSFEYNEQEYIMVVKEIRDDTASIALHRCLQITATPPTNP